ncbi:MAG: preprotein translocase subunit YajC [Sphingomonadales bacterium]|nr:preprotein translocase subunit YajC [Sphingomonadales bacterium]
MSHLHRRLAMLAACTALTAPLVVHAQSLPYGDTDSASSDQDSSGGTSSRGSGGRGHKRITIVPYIEAAQVVDAQLKPGNDVLTYSSLAAGVDAGIHGHNAEGSMSLRYERRFGWGKVRDGDVVSGAARGSIAIVPRVLTFEAGGLATRTRVEANGSTAIGGNNLGDSVSQIYSVYAGPALQTHVGDVAVEGHYRAGFNKVGSPHVVVSPTQAPVDIFDHSVVQNAELHAGIKPGEGLPVGVGVGAGFNQEDMSNLDQRARDLHARADVTVPLTHDVALVGGIGYEDVTISSRDAVRDANGNPVVGSKGHYITDKSAPRTVAYDTSGLIWDAGVMWRPSRRTSFEARYGRRYGSTSVSGNFAYAPSDRTAINASVYDNVAGFGSQLTNALAQMPADFQMVRNPLTGDMSGCVSSLDKGNCLSGVLGSVRSSTFRARGGSASISHSLGRMSAGLAVGYDRRRYVAAPGTALAFANGVVDESVWVASYFGAKLDQRSSLTANVYANWFQSGFASTGDGTGIGANAAYSRSITDHLSASAALGIDGISRETLDDVWNASALVGVRYSF